MHDSRTGQQVFDCCADAGSDRNNRPHDRQQKQRVPHRAPQGFAHDDHEQHPELGNDIARHQRDGRAQPAQARNQDDRQQQEQRQLQRLGPKQQRAAIAVIGVAERQDRRRADAHPQQQRDGERRIVGNCAMGPDFEEIRPEHQRARCGQAGE